LLFSPFGKIEQFIYPDVEIQVRSDGLDRLAAFIMESGA